MKTDYTEKEIYCIALSLVKGVGYRQSQRLINHFGTAEMIFSASLKDISQITYISRKIIEEIVSKKTIQQAENLINKHIKDKISLLTPWDTLYPYRLKHIPDAPVLLFCKGTKFINHPKIIGVVGTRNSSPYGKKVVQNILKELAEYNPLIISGLAYGIDITAHKTALEIGLPTVAVYAGGIDVVYPKDHIAIAKKISSHGSLITEHPIGTPIETYQFPARNRIVAGMSDAVIVVEAPQKSGALITAIYANDYNREVFAVPGNIYDRNSIGCHNLIINHQAHIITSAKDLLQIMNWDRSQKKINPPKQLDIKLETTLSQEEKSIIQIISQYKEGIHIDNISDATKLPIGRISSLLLKLEMDDYISTMPGKKYQLA